MSKNEIILKKIEKLEETLKIFEKCLSDLKSEYDDSPKITTDHKTGCTIYNF